MVRIFALPVLCCVSLLATLASAAQIKIDTVLVDNAGNADDVTGFGGVAYNYRIGTTEVTNDQYAAFLNEKCKSGQFGLYNPGIGGLLAGINVTGSPGGRIYTAKPNMGNKPVNFVSWYDAIRFANWLNNGQGSGDTETGAYTILGGKSTPTDGLSITRNAGATWFLTSEDEWYKAAYHQPAAQGGDSDDYWLYPTASNTTPTKATADSMGNINNPGANVVNYSQGAMWNVGYSNPTSVGSAGPLSNSFYGTADQGGNFGEMNESLIGSTRGARGGSWNWDASSLQAILRFVINDPTTENYATGFRVATIYVPEPSSLALAAFGIAGLAAWGLRRRSR